MSVLNSRPSPTRNLYEELSSPDPLAESAEEDLAATSPTRRRSAGNTTKRRPSATHRRKANGIEVSPSKMVAEQSLSPWRIKVTVEAEPEDSQLAELRGGKTQRITRTMQVPLRDTESTQWAVAQKQGAVKKRTSRRSASPARTTYSTRQSLTDLDIVVLGDDAAEDEWGVKPKSPRKRRNSKGRASKKSAQATRTSNFGAFEVRGDEEFAGTNQDEERASIEDGSPELQELNLNKVAQRTRPEVVESRTDQKKEQSERIDSRKVSINSAMSYPTPSPTASEHGRSDATQPPEESFDEPGIGLDTVMESEGFTMIDLDTLHSVKQMRTTAGEPAIQEEEEEEEAEQSTADSTTNEMSRGTVEAPSIAVTEDDTGVSDDLSSSPPDNSRRTKSKIYKIGHLKLPSSTNVQRHRLVTPMPQDSNPFSSPVLPSPPRAPTSATKDRLPVRSGKALHAASALQDAVTPEQSLLSEHESIEQTRNREEESLFGAFSTGTRRELRADLRFGEELGKKQPQTQSLSVQQNRPLNPSAPTIGQDETSELPPLPSVHVAKQETASGSKAENVNVDIHPDAFTGHEAGWQSHWQKEREGIIEQANKIKPILIESGDEEQEEDDERDDPEDTIGDIWLAEARQTSSSPRDPLLQTQAPKETSSYRPRRKLIPSPWKRGQRIDTIDVSHASGNESLSGLFWKQASSGARFGDAIVAHPDRAAYNAPRADRRRSGMYNADQMVIMQSQRLSPRDDSDDEEDAQDVDDENFDEARGNVQWRSAQDVVEEETLMLEEEHNSSVPSEEQRDHEAGTTRLYETNLEDVPEQDLSSSPQIQRKEIPAANLEHDSTYSSISEASDIEQYRQRTSLSPSKERPNTPKSAMKGTRLSFGPALIRTDSDETSNARKVVWARKSKCMNDDWEESTRSVRSTQESSSLEETSDSPEKLARQGTEASFEVQPRPPQQEQPKTGWFEWFKKDDRDVITQAPNPEQPKPQAPAIHSLDGSIDAFIASDNDEANSEASFKPTSRHAIAGRDPIATRQRNEPTPAKLDPDTIVVKLQQTSDHPSLPSLTPVKAKIPSYLLPPSYPSDPTRDPTVPLATSGPFTNMHFKTLHIIYRKSFKSRFHAPAYPDETRPQIRKLVEQQWKLEVDETNTMGEDGCFMFVMAEIQARVLERFMREVEHGYHQRGVEDVVWAWSVEDLAGWLGRIAVGESVREEEKAAEQILRSARKVRLSC